MARVYQRQLRRSPRIARLILVGYKHKLSLHTVVYASSTRSSRAPRAPPPRDRLGANSGCCCCRRRLEVRLDHLKYCTVPALRLRRLAQCAALRCAAVPPSIHSPRARTCPPLLSSALLSSALRDETSHKLPILTRSPERHVLSSLLFSLASPSASIQTRTSLISQSLSAQRPLLHSPVFHSSFFFLSFPPLFASLLSTRRSAQRSARTRCTTRAAATRRAARGPRRTRRGARCCSARARASSHSAASRSPASSSSSPRAPRSPDSSRDPTPACRGAAAASGTPHARAHTLLCQRVPAVSVSLQLVLGAMVRNVFQHSPPPPLQVPGRSREVPGGRAEGLAEGLRRAAQRDAPLPVRQRADARDPLVRRLRRQCFRVPVAVTVVSVPGSSWAEPAPAGALSCTSSSSEAHAPRAGRVAARTHTGAATRAQHVAPELLAGRRFASAGRARSSALRAQRREHRASRRSRSRNRRWWWWWWLDLRTARARRVVRWRSGTCSSSGARARTRRGQRRSWAPRRARSATCSSSTCSRRSTYVRFLY